MCTKSGTRQDEEAEESKGFHNEKKMIRRWFEAAYAPASKA